MTQTTPFKVVTGVAVIPQQPFAHLYQHVRQRDPRLAETLERLSAPTNIQNNLSNPLQMLTFGLSSPVTLDTTPWATILSNVSTDETNYFPLIINGSVRLVSTTDVQLDFKVSHDNGTNFVSLLNSPFIIPATTNVPVGNLVGFAPGSYLRNHDRVYMQLLSAAFDGADINCDLMFQ